MTTRLQRILGCCALAGLIATGCGSVHPAPASLGTMTMALTDTQGTTTYHLVNAMFDLAGPPGFQAQLLTPAPDTQSLSVDLQPGQYTLTLGAGWQLESSVDGGSYQAVTAALASPAVQTFTIYDQQVTNLRYRFRIGSDVIAFGDGQLQVGIDVLDGTECAVTPGTCSGATITCAGPWAAMRDACTFSTNTDGTQITCGASSATVASGLSTAPNGYSEAVQTLADLQGRMLTYYRTHGHFPVGYAPRTPAATCCQAGGVYQCPANPYAWNGVAAWDALGFFSIETAHSFVYSYASADGQTAQAVASGDLDCDAVMVDDTLECSVSGGNPSCTLRTSDCAGD